MKNKLFFNFLIAQCFLYGMDSENNDLLQNLISPEKIAYIHQHSQPEMQMIDEIDDRNKSNDLFDIFSQGCEYGLDHLWSGFNPEKNSSLTGEGQESTSYSLYEDSVEKGVKTTDKISEAFFIEDEGLEKESSQKILSPIVEQQIKYFKNFLLEHEALIKKFIKADTFEHSNGDKVSVLLEQEYLEYIGDKITSTVERKGQGAGGQICRIKQRFLNIIGAFYLLSSIENLKTINKKYLFQCINKIIAAQFNGSDRISFLLSVPQSVIEERIKGFKKIKDMMENQNFRQVGSLKNQQLK